MVRWTVAVITLLALQPGMAVGQSGFDEICQRDNLSTETQAACSRLVCTFDTVAGVFGFNEDTLEGGAAGEPLATIGLLDLRPDGTAAIREDAFAERGGEPVIGDAVEGEWTVESSCFGFIDFPEVLLPSGETNEVDYAFVAVENGTELFLIRNNPLEEADAKLLFRR